MEAIKMFDYGVDWEVEISPDEIVEVIPTYDGHVLLVNTDGLYFEVDAEIWKATCESLYPA